MSRVTFGSKGGRVKTTVVKDKNTETMRSAEDVVRDLKANGRASYSEDYRERSLSIHGLICARCSREFDHTNRHLLTVHHKDGNHDNNPPDGSNWENLCAYCHEDVHSRSVLGDYLQGEGRGGESALVYSEGQQEKSLGSLGAKLAQAMKHKKT